VPHKNIFSFYLKENNIINQKVPFPTHTKRGGGGPPPPPPPSFVCCFTDTVCEPQDMESSVAYCITANCEMYRVSARVWQGHVYFRLHFVFANKIEINWPFFQWNVLGQMCRLSDSAGTDSVPMHRMFLKPRKNYTSWRVSLPENISLNFRRKNFSADINNRINRGWAAIRKLSRILWDRDVTVMWPWCDPQNKDSYLPCNS